MKKYIIDKDNPNEKLLYYNVDVVGLSVTPNKSVPGYKITAKKLTLVDPDLREAYIKQKINKKIDRVIKFMIKILNDEDTSDEDAGIVLDEINKLKKGIVIDNRKVDIKRFKVRKKDVEKNTSIVELTIVEGRNHIVKKIFESMRIDVIKLSRVSYAFLTLDGLKSGEYRKLSIKEIKKLYALKKC